MHASNLFASNISAFSLLNAGCREIKALAQPAVTVLSDSVLKVYFVSMWFA